MSQATTNSAPDWVAHAQMSTGRMASLLTAKTALRRSCRSPRRSPMQASSSRTRIVVRVLRTAKMRIPPGPFRPSRSAGERLASPTPTPAEMMYAATPTPAAAVNMSDRAWDLSAASSLIKRVLSPITQKMPRNWAADCTADAVPTASAGASRAATNQ
jgi:hypothetical protein